MTGRCAHGPQRSRCVRTVSGILCCFPTRRVLMYVVDCTQMEPFWPPTALPSKAERTHVWYVSNIDCSLYPAGTALTSPTFTCGGLDGLCLKLFPKGTKKNRPGMAAACLSSNRDHGVVVCTCIHIHVFMNTRVSSTLSCKKAAHVYMHINIYIHKFVCIYAYIYNIMYNIYT